MLPNRHVSNLIEKDGAAVSEFETSDAVGSGIGECAFDVAEEFALEDPFRQCSGVYRN